MCQLSKCQGVGVGVSSDFSGNHFIVIKFTFGYWTDWLKDFFHINLGCLNLRL